jgi:hypothetical protein
MYVSITRIPYPVYPIIPYPVSHYPVSRGIPIPVSRIPLSLVEGQALRNAGLTRGWHRSRAHLVEPAGSLCISARPPRGPRPPSRRPRPRHRPRAYRWVGGAEWSPKSPRPSPRLRDEALVALRRGRGARRGGWRGCFQALLVELSACGGERHATQSATARGGKAISGRHCKRNALSALQ